MELKKYSEKSLEFIYNEAQKQFDDIMHSFKEITNKSYVLTGIIISTISATSILKDFDLQNIILTIVLVIPLFLIYKNLTPTSFVLRGAQPKLMQHEYFERDLETQYKRYLIQRIEDIQVAITQNGAILDKRSKRLTRAIASTVILLLISFFFWS